MLRYENSRHKEAIKEFLIKDYEQYKIQGKIPEKMTKLTLFYRYLERYVDKRMPIWNKELDDLAFRELGLQDLTPVWKIGYAVGVLSVICFLFLVCCMCVCLRVTAQRYRDKDYVRSKARKEQPAGKTKNNKND